MGKYYLEHDSNFLLEANLEYFNRKILDISGNTENDYIFNLIKDAPINSCILDIGSFNGDTSIYLSKKLKQIKRSDIKIYCFEPNKNNCDNIRKHKKIDNLNIEIIESIISNKSQKMYMKKNEGAGTMYDTCFDKNNKVYESKKLDEFEIKNIYLAKIDVEGHEPEVIEGGKNSLKNCKYMYVEMWNDKHFIDRHKIRKEGSHNKRILKNIKECNENFFPIQKIEKNILFERKV